MRLTERTSGIQAGADDRAVSLAGRGVLQPKHAAGSGASRLTIGRCDGKDPLQDDAELNRWSGVVETVSRSCAPHFASNHPTNARETGKSLPISTGGAGARYCSGRGGTPERLRKSAIGRRSAGDWTLYHLRDRGALFDKLLHGLRFDLVARPRQVDVDLRKHGARSTRKHDDPIG
jgi:hypothetical protein